MRTQIKKRSIILVLAIVLFALAIVSSAQTTGRGFNQPRSSRTGGFAAIGRKVAADLNPQPLPPCAKCGASPAQPHGDPMSQVRVRPFRSVR